MSKLTEALAKWGVIKSETQRNANTAARIGEAGIAILEVVEEKVDKVAGKALSTNDYTNEAVAEVAKVKDKVDKVAGKALSTNDYTNEAAAEVAKVAFKADLVNGIVPKAQLPAAGDLVVWIDYWLSETGDFNPYPQDGEISYVENDGLYAYNGTWYEIPILQGWEYIVRYTHEVYERDILSGYLKVSEVKTLSTSVEVLTNTIGDINSILDNLNGEVI